MACELKVRLSLKKIIENMEEKCKSEQTFDELSG